MNSFPYGVYEVHEDENELKLLAGFDSEFLAKEFVVYVLEEVRGPENESEYRVIYEDA